MGVTSEGLSGFTCEVIRLVLEELPNDDGLVSGGGDDEVSSLGLVLVSDDGSHPITVSLKESDMSEVEVVGSGLALHFVFN